MIKNFFIFFGVLALPYISFAGTDIQNGGGGISVNGEVATFYSAEMKVFPTPLGTNDDFAKLEFSIGRLPIPNRVKLELIQNITPSYMRRYYSVVNTYVDDALLKRIKLEYNRVTNIPVENLTIFALTDPKTQITLLLPDFFKLTDQERQSILLHESLWVNKRVASYAEMLQIDRAAQIYFTFPNDCVSINQIIMQLEHVFKERLWALNSSLSCEIKNYIKYSNNKFIPFLDFMDYPSLTILAELLINSSEYYQSKEIQAKLADTMEIDDARIFTTTKANLIRELRSGMIIKAEFDGLTRSGLENSRRTREEIQYMTGVLLKAKFLLKETDSYNVIKLSSPELGDIYLSTPDERITAKK